MRILVVEDETGVAGFVKQGLTEAGYVVDVARDGSEGLEYALAFPYDAIVLDIMLPKMNGLDVLREIRERRVKSPVLLLTARDTIDDRVQGLDFGADDYLVKPFAFAELLARIRSLLRRPPLQTGNVIRISMNGRIRVTGKKDSTHLVVDIRNTGSVIPDGHLPRLFERFYRVDSDRSSQTGGSGLGLAIAQEIAHLHGGEITVKSDAIEGVRFSIHLPAL